MSQQTANILATGMILTFLLPLSAIASEENRAKQLCKSKIEDVYGVSNFRNVWSEREGHHKFRVHGQVRTHHRKYDFNCKIKHGNVKSYAYNGPHDRHDRHRHKDDDSHVGKAVAVGAGLAIVAAITASHHNRDDNDRDTSSAPPVSKSVMEDECHDMLQYRIRDEHDHTARVRLKDARIQGHDLVGDARVRYDREHPHHATYTCHFNSRGRLLDSSYHLY